MNPYDAKEAKVFDEKLTKLLRNYFNHTGKKGGKRERERFKRMIIISFWIEVTRQMIEENKAFEFNNHMIRISIARLPIGKDGQLYKLMNSKKRNVVFTSLAYKKEQVFLSIRLNQRNKRHLISELYKGHTYDIGKPKFNNHGSSRQSKVS